MAYLVVSYRVEYIELCAIQQPITWLISHSNRRQCIYNIKNTLSTLPIVRSINTRLVYCVPIWKELGARGLGSHSLYISFEVTLFGITRLLFVLGLTFKCVFMHCDVAAMCLCTYLRANRIMYMGLKVARRARDKGDRQSSAQVRLYIYMSDAKYDKIVCIKPSRWTVFENALELRAMQSMWPRFIITQSENNNGGCLLDKYMYTGWENAIVGDAALPGNKGKDALVICRLIFG